MTIRKYGTLIALVGFGFAYGVVGCGGDGGDDDRGATPGKSSGGSGGKASGGSGGKASGGSGGKASGGSGGKTGGTGGSTGGTGGKTGGTGGSTGGTGGSTGGTGGTAGSTGGTGGTPMVMNCANANPNLTMGLVGHWKFDEGTGITAADASGNSNGGTVVEGGTTAATDHPSPTWGAGKKGMGLKLDGENDWVRVADSDSIDSTGINNGVSSTAWAKIDKINTVKDYNFITMRHEVGTRTEHFGLGMFQGLPVGNIHFFKAIGPQNVPIGEWVHLAQTYDGITTRVYVNGAEVSFLDVGWPIAADETPFTIGAGINEEDVIEHVAGTVDEVRLYNRELTACEVQEAMK